jgi:Tol biopolymer transport system component
MGVALAAAAISPASAKPPIGATDLFGIAYAMGPALSPDGRAVAYLKEWMDPKADTYRSQLWLSDFEGRSQRAASDEADDVAEPRWSPDGRTLAFVARSDVADEARQIYISRQPMAPGAVSGRCPPIPIASHGRQTARASPSS